MKYNIPVAEPDIGDEEIKKVIEAVQSGWVSSKGPFIEEFENKFSTYIGVKNGITTSNGTAALHLALEALGIGEGMKVLVPSLTFISTANAVIYTGAEPIFVDAHPEYWCIDPLKIEEKIDENTKAIILVHLYGHPCDMDPILRIANNYGIYVIEDCAEAHGAEYKGKKVGSFGDISCFSFYGNKIITTGEGGMCLTNDEELSLKMKILRDHGMSLDRKYWHEVVGFNYRMTNLQAALGVAQMEKIDKLISKKRWIASLYNDLFLDINEIKIAPEMPWAKNVYWLYSILVKMEIRDCLIERMNTWGIETRPFFHPSHKLPPYDSGIILPVTEELSAMGVNLPSGFLLTENQIKKIVEIINETLRTSNF